MMFNFFRNFFFILILLVVPFFNLVIAKETPPQYAEIMKILEPLEYSGFSEIVNDDVSLEIDFKNKKWILHNVYNFDKYGNIKLTDERKGLCGRLSRFVYSQIKSKFPLNKYELKFCKVIENRFFNTDDATHIVISILNKTENKEYIIDPSFKEYKLKKEFNGYSFKEYLDTETFIKFNLNQYKFFDVDMASPIFIRNDYLISFSVESIDGKFDKNHYILSINATKRSDKSCISLFTFRFIEGHFQDSFDDKMTKILLSSEEALMLYRRVLIWTIKIQEIQP